MSESYIVSLVNTAWTDISVSNVIGFITNTSTSTIILEQADSLPSSTLEQGHPLEAFRFLNFSLSPGESVFARSIQPIGEVLVTPGLGFGDRGGLLRNTTVDVFEENLDGETTKVFTSESRHIILINDSKAKDLQFKFADADTFATVQASETIALDFSASQIILNTPTQAVDFRLWVFK